MKSKRAALRAGTPPERSPALSLGGLDIFTRRELTLPNEVQGVVVHDVAENSPAHKAGLRSGDIITEVNCTSVISVDHALTLAEAWKDARILLQVWSEKGLRHLTIHKR